MGDAAAAADPPDHAAAEAAYRDALDLAQSLGMRPLVAHSRLGLGRLYRRAGERARATEQLAAATQLYRDMAMRTWLAKADHEVAQLP